MSANDKDMKKQLRKKYHAIDPMKTDKQVSDSINVSADVEYNKSYTLGWGGLMMFDRLQSKVTGLAITNNTQKKIDAAKLAKEEDKPENNQPGNGPVI